MPADRLEPPEPGPAIGFHSYADDTPRAAAPHPDPAPGDEIPPRTRPEPSSSDPPREPRRFTAPLVLTAAAVLGVAAGSWLALGPSAPEDVAAARGPPATPTLNLQVADPEPPPPPAPRPADKLEVLRPASLPERLSSLARRVSPPTEAPAPVRREPLAPAAPGAPMAQAVTGTPAASVAEATPRVEQPPLIQPSPPVGPRPGIGGPAPSDCGSSRTHGEAMVCADARLAALDRRLARAYAAALHAGGPTQDLEADQDDWLAIREEAAAVSPDAVANIYRQRIQELEVIAGASPR